MHVFPLGKGFGSRAKAVTPELAFGKAVAVKPVTLVGAELIVAGVLLTLLSVQQFFQQ
jgi:hypothetical protein